MIRSRKTGLPAGAKKYHEELVKRTKTRRGASPTGQFGCPILHEGGSLCLF